MVFAPKKNVFGSFHARKWKNDGKLYEKQKKIDFFGDES